MNTIPTFRNQVGAVLTFEYVVLIVVGGLSAIGLGLWLAGHFVDTVHGWLGTLISVAEGMFQDYNDNWCNAAVLDTGATQQGPLLQFVSLPDQIPLQSCNAAGGATTQWVDITSN